MKSHRGEATGASRVARDDFMNDLRREGVASRRGLMAVHLEEPYRTSGPRARTPAKFGRIAGPLPVSEEADAQTLILPLYPDLGESDQQYVIDRVRDALARRAAGGER